MNNERYVRKEYTIWDTYSDREVQKLNHRYQANHMCELLNEKEAIITEQKEKVARVLNEYSRQFKRHSKEFSFMLDLAEDLGIESLEAKDD